MEAVIQRIDWFVRDKSKMTRGPLQPVSGRNPFSFFSFNPSLKRPGYYNTYFLIAEIAKRMYRPGVFPTEPA
jgi:hypothetical protein